MDGNGGGGGGEADDSNVEVAESDVQNESGNNEDRDNKQEVREKFSVWRQIRHQVLKIIFQKILQAYVFGICNTAKDVSYLHISATKDREVGENTTKSCV